MARFQYTAAATDGRALSGETSAPDAAAVASDLGRRGLILTSLTRLKADESGLFETSINPRRVTVLLGELAMMLRSGLPLDEALELAAEGLPRRLARIALRLRTDVLGGSSFVQALERHPRVFPREIVAMARVADATGDLDGVFTAVAAQRERAHLLAEKISGALRYPAFLVVSAIGVLVFFLLQVIPQFAGLFSDSATDPGVMVHLILGLSDALIRNEVACGATLFALVLAGVLLWRVESTRTALTAAFLKAPGIAGTWRLWRTSRFLSSLAILLSQGVLLTEALRVLEDSVGADGRSRLAAVGDTVRRGGRLHEALAQARLLPPVAIRMIRIGEETGELAKIAGEAGGLYARQLEKRLDTLSGLVGPIAIVVIAGLIGGLMVTIMTALVSVNQAVF